MGEQHTLFPDLELAPTPAMLKGESRLYGCRQCGALLCIPSEGPDGPVGRQGPQASKLGPCAGCGCRSWHEYKIESHHVAGPFHARRKVYCEECGSALEEE